MPSFTERAVARFASVVARATSRKADPLPPGPGSAASGLRMLRAGELTEPVSSIVWNVRFSAPETPLPPIELSTERLTQVHALIGVVVDWANERGVDVSRRLSAEQVYPYDERGWEALLHERGRAQYVFGMADSFARLQVLDDGSTFALGSHQHEFIHLATTRTWVMPAVPMQGFSQVGLPIPHGGGLRRDLHPRTAPARTAFETLDELLTELVNIELRQKRWSEHPSLPKLDFSGPGGYPEALIVGDALIRKAALHQGSSYAQVNHSLQKGLLDGSLSCLRPMAAALGPDAMKVIAGWSESDFETCLEVATRLDLQDAVDRLSDFDAGRSVELAPEILPQPSFDKRLVYGQIPHAARARIRRHRSPGVTEPQITALPFASIEPSDPGRTAPPVIRGVERGPVDRGRRSFPAPDGPGAFD